MKASLESAEERCEELQRLLEASRASEAQVRAHLRMLQKQHQQLQQLQQQQSHKDQRCESADELQEVDPVEECGSAAGSASGSLSPRPESDEAVCRLVEDMAEVEDRLHGLESEWIEEKRKRQALEAEVAALLQDNQRLQQQLIEASSGSFALPAAITSLSLSEELLISSGDFTSAQWRDAWDNSGPLSLIGSVLTDDGSKRKDYETEYSEEVNADGDVIIYQRKNIRMLCSSRAGRTPERENDDTFSSSSGFSDENRWMSRSTQTDPDPPPVPVSTVTTVDDDPSDYKQLFKQIFAIIKQNT